MNIWKIRDDDHITGHYGPVWASMGQYGPVWQLSQEHESRNNLIKERFLLAAVHHVCNCYS